MLSLRNNAGRFLRATKKLRGDETGVTLLETLVALALLSIIAVVFLGGLTTIATATLINNEQATAESLARSQMEYVKSQDYIYYADPDHGEYDGLATPPVSYGIDFTAVPFNPDTGQPYEQTGGIFVEDAGIQKITVTVNHNGKLVLTVEDYKVER